MRWRHSLETGEPYRSPNFRIRRADGSYRMTRSRGVAVRGEDGAIRRWYGTTEDIEEEVARRAGAARGGRAPARKRGNAPHHARDEPADRLDGRGRRQRPGAERALSGADRHRRRGPGGEPDRSIPTTATRSPRRWADSVASGMPFNRRMPPADEGRQLPLLPRAGVAAAATRTARSCAGTGSPRTSTIRSRPSSRGATSRSATGSPPRRPTTRSGTMISSTA